MEHALSKSMEDVDGLQIHSVMGRNLLRAIDFAERHGLPAVDVVQRSLEPPRRLTRWFGAQRVWDRTCLRLHAATDSAGPRAAASDYLSMREQTALRIAQQTGTLGPIGDELMVTPPASGLRRWRSGGTIRQIIRSLLGILYLALMLIFHGVYVFERIRLMFQELGANLANDWFLAGAERYGFWLLGVVMVMALGVIAWSLYQSVVSGRSFGVNDYLEVLGINLNAGRPAAATSEATVRWIGDSRLRRRLVDYQRDPEATTHPWAAMHRSGLIGPSLQSALELAPDRSAVAWLLRHAAQEDRRRRRTILRGAWRSAAWAVFIAFAVATLLTSVAIFTTLMQFVSVLS